jgi:AAA15 family ATPase/GTPase
MIESLEIKNYRNLKHLTLHKLGRVNLFVGKNNTGKTSVLEAISIYHKRGSLDWVFQEILENRKENLVDSDSKKYQELAIESLSSLFTNRIIPYTVNDAIQIKEPLDSSSEFSLRFAKYIQIKNEVPDEEGMPEFLAGMMGIIDKMSSKRLEVASDYRGARIGVEVKNGNIVDFHSLDKDRDFIEFISNFDNDTQSEDLRFIRSRDINQEENIELWSKIALTEREQDVINALKILEPRVERLAYVQVENSEEQVPKIKLEGQSKPWSILTMGDGINRILTFILNLVNIKDGILLIDEFENGLHYSVQESLWEVIFATAHKLNLQVFVTTHSNDCINAFSRVMERFPKYSDGRMIRLDNKNGDISAKEFEAEKLQIADENGIELR